MHFSFIVLVIFLFIIVISLYFIDTGDVVAPLARFDTYSFLYKGNNNNNNNVPTGCPYFAQLIKQSDTGDNILLYFVILLFYYFIILLFYYFIVLLFYYFIV
jgi:hypothetical protein